MRTACGILFSGILFLGTTIGHALATDTAASAVITPNPFHFHPVLERINDYARGSNTCLASEVDCGRGWCPPGSTCLKNGQGCFAIPVVPKTSALKKRIAPTPAAVLPLIAHPVIRMDTTTEIFNICRGDEYSTLGGCCPAGHVCHPATTSVPLTKRDVTPSTLTEYVTLSRSNSQLSQSSTSSAWPGHWTTWTISSKGAILIATMTETTTTFTPSASSSLPSTTTAVDAVVPSESATASSKSILVVNVYTTVTYSSSAHPSPAPSTSTILVQISSWTTTKSVTMTKTQFIASSTATSTTTPCTTSTFVLPHNTTTGGAIHSSHTTTTTTIVPSSSSSTMTVSPSFCYNNDINMPSACPGSNSTNTTTGGPSSITLGSGADRSSQLTLKTLAQRPLGMVFTLGLCLVLLAFDELTPARLALLLADAVMTNSWGCMTFLTTTIFFQFLRAGAMVGPTALQAFIQVR